jgi:tetratricopeptide (TPR) repeat protein
MHSSAYLRSALITAAIVALFASLAAPAARAAEPTREARAATLRDQATAAFDAGKYAEAARLFLEAYESFPNGWLLYNAARAQHNAGELQAALDSYRLFIGSPESDAEYRERASQYIIEIEQVLHPPQPPDVEKPAVTGPKTPITGPRVGGGTGTGQGSVGGAGQTQLTVTAKTASSAGRTKRVAGWAMTVLGAGLGVTAALLHFDATKTRNDIRSDTGGGGVVDASVLTQREALDAAARADRREMWSAVTLGAGAAALVTGVVLIIRGKEPRSTQVGVTPLPGGAVAGLRGSF